MIMFMMCTPESVVPCLYIAGDMCDGEAIFYKHTVFKLIECQKVEFFVDKKEVLDRDNVGESF